MATLWQAIWLVGVALLLHLQLTGAAQHHRQLAQNDEGRQEVSNAEELLYAILNKTDNIHFTSNFTLPGNTFPGTEAVATPVDDDIRQRFWTDIVLASSRTAVHRVAQRGWQAID